jgi:hypothetical protein
MLTTLPLMHSSTSGKTRSGHGDVKLNTGQRGGAQFKLMNNVVSALNSVALSIALFSAAASASKDNKKNIFCSFLVLQIHFTFTESKRANRGTWRASRAARARASQPRGDRTRAPT